MNGKVLTLSLLVTVLGIGITSAYAEDSRVIFAEDATVLVEIIDGKAQFHEAFVGEHVILSEDIKIDRPEEDKGRVFGTTTAGDNVYLKYDLNTGKVLVKIWTDSEKIRLVSIGEVIRVF